MGGGVEEGQGRSKAGKFPWGEIRKQAAEKLVPLLISTAAFAAFVAFAGTVVLWARFEALQLPPDQIVDAVPQGEAFVVGAVMLMVFGLFGALAAFAVYLIDRGGRATPGMSRGLLSILAVEGAAAIWLAGDKPIEDRVLASEVVVIALGAILWATFVGGLIKHTKVRDRAGKEEPQAEEDRAFRKAHGESNIERGPVLAAICAALVAGVIAFFVATRLDAGTTRAWIVALAAASLLLLLVATVRWASFEQAKENRRRKEEAASDPKEKKAEVTGSGEKAEDADEGEEKYKPPGIELSHWGFLLVGLLAFAAVLVPSLILKEAWLAASLSAVFLLGIGLWRIAQLSSQFAWYGLAVFLSVPLFGTLMLMARNVDNPQVQPIALIRITDGPRQALQGLYVTETSDRVYFANVATEGCGNEVTGDSGRLVSVQKDDVVAMAIGPLQDVKSAGKAALEMSYALTPGVETPGGEAGEDEDAGAAASTTSDQAPDGTAAPTARLESAGPAVRPNFGAGLRLIPESAEPGSVVTLRMSAPNSHKGVHGFGPTPDGRTLRLDGVRLAIARETTPQASKAEYVETDTGTEQVLKLDKGGVYHLRKDGLPYPLEAGSKYRGERFVKLAEGATVEVQGGGLDGWPEYLKVRGDAVSAELAGSPKVSLGTGRLMPLKPGFLRQAWDKDEIEFEVPENATSGAITVECDQLAGQPLLTVVGPPAANIAVRMQSGSNRVVFDSGRSRGEDDEKLSRRWTIAERSVDGRPRVAASLRPRLGAYAVQLTVTDPDGESDTARLRLLRLPAALFGLDRDQPQDAGSVEEVRRAVLGAAPEVRPAAIELYGHADDVGTDDYNVSLSMRRAEHVSQLVLDSDTNAGSGGAAESSELALTSVARGRQVPVTMRAFGETCPIDRGGGPQLKNRRVEVFILGQGTTVTAPIGCHAGRKKHTSW